MISPMVTSLAPSLAAEKNPFQTRWPPTAKISTTGIQHSVAVPWVSPVVARVAVIVVWGSGKLRKRMGNGWKVG
jgi:hypothetical protein